MEPFKRSRGTADADGKARDVDARTGSRWTGSPAATAATMTSPPRVWSGRVLAGVPLLGGLLAAAIAWLVLRSHLGDYPNDAGPAIQALAEGSFRRAAAVPFLMGPLSVVLRAPFVWVAHALGAGETGGYRTGLVPCLAVAAGLGVALARRSAVPSRTETWPLLVPLLAVLSPASLAAVRSGHPEEALGGALCVAAVLLAGSRRATLGGLALGLAIATKQWALIAAAPVVLAAPARLRPRVAVVAALTAAVVYVPFIARDPEAFMTATGLEAHVISVATPETAWLIASHEREMHVAGSPLLTYHPVPGWVAPFSHSLIVALAVVAAVALWRRRLETRDALGLLALLFLLRCVLDPVDQDYFHLPFLLALLAWEVECRRLWRGLPVVTLAAAACLWLSFTVLHANVGAWRANAVYLGWTIVAAGFLAVRTARAAPAPAD